MLGKFKRIKIKIRFNIKTNAADKSRFLLFKITIIELLFIGIYLEPDRIQLFLAHQE